VPNNSSFSSWQQLVTLHLTYYWWFDNHIRHGNTRGEGRVRRWSAERCTRSRGFSPIAELLVFLHAEGSIVVPDWTNC